MPIKFLSVASQQTNAGEVKKQMYEGNPPSPRSFNYGKPSLKPPFSPKDYLVTFEVGSRGETTLVERSHSPSQAINTALYQYALAVGLEPKKFIATHRSSAKAKEKP